MASQLAFSCVEAFAQNIMYGVLYAFTPEIREAWVAAWDVVAGAMVAGLQIAERESPEDDDGQVPMGLAEAAP